jgi:hypothetical protein
MPLPRPRGERAENFRGGRKTEVVGYREVTFPMENRFLYIKQWGDGITRL